MTTKDEGDAVSSEANKFPIGLRVLVVDDDLCCLKLVETFLKKCNYNVTTTTQPLEAYKMLREDKNRFDIVITEVVLPGMDGFMLLQLIRLELDIPVIMLSAYGDEKYVLKGFEHGACDYLVKPCQMLELQNIWMHVSKWKHTSETEQNKNSPKQDDEQGLAPPEKPANYDDSKAGQKRKEHNRGEEDENGGSDAQDPTKTLKKQRVVWSLELHQKFEEAIAHLTLEKVVPRKILDRMDVDGLTRGQVASHLQKYRLYKKRDEAAKNEQKNQMHARSLEGLQLQESQRLPNISFSSTPPSAVLSRFNYPSRYKVDEIASQNMNHSFGLLGNFQQSQFPELYYGNSRSFEVNPVNNISGFSYPARFPNNGVALSSSINSRLRLLSSRSYLQGKQHVLGAAPLKSESFSIGTHATSNHWGHDQSIRDLQQGIHLSTHYHHQMPWNNSRTLYAQSFIGLLPMNAVQNPQPNFPVEIPCQENPISRKPKGEGHKSFIEHNLNHSAMNPLPLAVEIMDHNVASAKNADISQFSIQSNDGIVSPGQHNEIMGHNEMVSSKMSVQSDDGTVSPGQHNAVDIPLAESSMDLDFLDMEDVLSQIDFDSLDDMIMKLDEIQELNDQTTTNDGVLLP